MKDKIERKVEYCRTGRIFCEEYYKNDKRHREDGPALNFYNEHGIKFREIYYIDNHIEGAPADIFYYENGQIYCEIYYKHDKLHRTDGPARIEYNIDGAIRTEEYWLNGTKYDDIFKWMITVGNLEVKQDEK